MKIKINENTIIYEHIGKNYPYIGIHNDDIDRQDPLLILFIAPNTGLLITKNNLLTCKTFNHIDDDWTENLFTHFSGSVTLTNSVLENRFVSDNKRKAIKIALDTYLNSYDGEPVDVYFRLLEEKSEDFDDIDYIDVWEKFENSSVESLIEYIDDLIEQILDNYGKENE